MPTPQAQDPKKKYVPAAAAIAAAGIIATGLTMDGEGTIYRAYDDARPSKILKPGDKIIGTLTACTGHTDKAGGPPIVIGKTYTPAECDAYLQHDRREAVATVIKLSPELYQNPPTAAAMEDFVLNVGPANYASSSIYRDFKAGRIREGCKRLFDWKYGRVKGVKVVINGLLRRRTAQYEKCVEGLS